MIINAAWGLGEAVVSSLVTPDTIVTDKSAVRIVSYEVANKEKHRVNPPQSRRIGQPPKHFLIRHKRFLLPPILLLINSMLSIVYTSRPSASEEKMLDETINIFLHGIMNEGGEKNEPLYPVFGA